MSDWRFIFFIWTENDRGETEVGRRDGSRRAFDERMCRELINARTPVEILSAMNDVNQDQEAVSRAQLVEVDAGELSRLQQLIIRPGEEGGILTQTEFMISKFVQKKVVEKNLIVACL